MAVLLGLYYILFEREKMHRFNRFYLLSTLVFSLALPFITVVTYIQEIPSFNQTVTINSAPAEFQPITEQPVGYLFYIAWSVYAIITLLLAVRFIKNFFTFFRKAKNNPSVTMGKAELILLEERVLPHTFLNYIFVNREEYEAKLIEDELYTHEYTHVKQKHTLDILFIEALKILFWFNPLLYCYKYAIQLNHEFLADEKVIDTTANTVYYQKLLLEKTTVGTTFSMASNLTFSLTKKRFIMMTKTTSATKAGFIKLALLPVVTILMMLLCTKTVAQKTTQEEAERLEKLKSMQVSDEEMDSLKKTNPDMFSDDLNVRFKDTKFTFVDKNGRETTVMGYKALNEKQKKSVSYAPEMYGMNMTIYEPVKTTETNAEFPGGDQSFIDFINKNITLPSVQNDITIKLKFTFTVKKDGTLDNVEVHNESQTPANMKEVVGQLQKEAVKALQKSPKWKPATRDGNPINSGVNYPFTIAIKV